MILVTGATGNNGSEIVKRLAAQNVSVRAMVRDRNQASAVTAANVEVVKADFDHPRTLLNALNGVERAFLVTNSTEHAQAQQLAFRESERGGRARHCKCGGSCPNQNWT